MVITARIVVRVMNAGSLIAGKIKSVPEGRNHTSRVRSAANRERKAGRPGRDDRLAPYADIAVRERRVANISIVPAGTDASFCAIFPALRTGLVSLVLRERI